MVPASYADAQIRERLNTFRKTKNANAAKIATARWLLKIVYHVLKEKALSSLSVCRNKVSHSEGIQEQPFRHRVRVIAVEPTVPSQVVG